MARLNKSLIAALTILAPPAVAETVEFTSAARWHVSCQAVRQSPDPFPIQSHSISFIWDRRVGVAEIDWGNGIKKIMRQLNNKADAVIHFSYGPETSLIVPEGQDRPIDCCYNSMLSIRMQGYYAITRHTVEYGDMRALSQEGTCTFTPLAD